MAELFLMGTLAFWLLLLSEVVLLFIFTAYENGLAATISLVAYVAIMQFFGGVDVLGYVLHNPLPVVAGVLSYFVIGTAWGVFKWWLFVRDRLEEYEDMKAEFLKKNGRTDTKTVPDDMKQAWRNRLHENWNGDLSKPPVARENKSRILNWMAFWVPSMMYSLLNDFVRRVFRAIYLWISAELQKISDSVYSGVRSDLPE